MTSLQLRANNHPISLHHQFTKTGIIIFEGYIPREALATGQGFSRLYFEVNQTITPNTLDPDSEDDRLLGVALHWLEVKPMEIRREDEMIQQKNLAPGSKDKTETENLAAPEFTGERYMPSLNWPEISYEHWHRYLFASQFVYDKSVLDIACGEGYGCNLLAHQAKNVIGVDIDPTVVQLAASKYRHPNLEFRAGPAQKIPVKGEYIFDVITCFETIEHLDEVAQLSFMAEVKRVLKPNGLLLISTPNKYLYNDQAAEKNQYHLKEFYMEEFEALLKNSFARVHLLGQKVYPVSYVWPLQNRDSKELTEYQLEYIEESFQPCASNKIEPLYFLAICTNEALTTPNTSVLLDISSQVIEQKAKLLELQAQQLNQQNHQLQHQETLIKAQETDRQAREEHYNQLKNVYEEARDYARSLETALQEKDEALNSMTTTLQEKDETLNSMTTTLQEKDETLNSMATALQEKDEALTFLQQELQAIHGSRAWRIAQGIQQLYRWFRQMGEKDASVGEGKNE